MDRENSVETVPRGLENLFRFGVSKPVGYGLQLINFLYLLVFFSVHYSEKLPTKPKPNRAGYWMIGLLKLASISPG